MNKTHLIILVVGFGGCLALMMMMGHLLKMSPEVRSSGAAAEAFSARFTSSLLQPPTLVVKPIGKPGEGVEVTAKIKPKATTDLDDMFTLMGKFLWNARFGDETVKGVVVRWTDPLTKAIQKTRLQPPSSRPTLRLYGPGSERRRRASSKPPAGR